MPRACGTRVQEAHLLGRGPAWGGGITGPFLAPLRTGLDTAPHFTDEDTEALSAALVLSYHLLVHGALLYAAGGTEMNQTHPGVGTHRGHRILCLAERCRLGLGEESGGSQGCWPSGRDPSRWAGALQAEAAARAEARGWGCQASLRLWQRLAGTWPGRWQDQGCLGSLSPAPPAWLQTVQAPPCLHTPFLAPQIIPIPRSRLLRLEIKCL